MKQFRQLPLGSIHSTMDAVQGWREIIADALRTGFDLERGGVLATFDLVEVDLVISLFGGVVDTSVMNVATPSIQSVLTNEKISAPTSLKSLSSHSGNQAQLPLENGAR